MPHIEGAYPVFGLLKKCVSNAIIILCVDEAEGSSSAQAGRPRAAAECLSRIDMQPARHPRSPSSAPPSPPAPAVVVVLLYCGTAVRVKGSAI